MWEVVGSVNTRTSGNMEVRNMTLRFVLWEHGWW